MSVLSTDHRGDPIELWDSGRWVGFHRPNPSDPCDDGTHYLRLGPPAPTPARPVRRTRNADGTRRGLFDR